MPKKGGHPMKNLSHQRLLRKLLLFVLTLSTVVALSVAVPAGAEGEGGVIYLNFKNTGIEAVTPTLSGEAGFIPSETMEYDEDLGLYWCAVSADALTVRFYVDFLDDREDILPPPSPPVKSTTSMLWTFPFAIKVF